MGKKKTPQCVAASSDTGNVCLAAAVIALAAVVAYWNSFSGPFVFDDYLSIPDNPTIRSLWPLSGPLSTGFHDGRTVDARPLLNLSFAINYALGGTNVWGYHAGNLLIHILAAWVLFGVLRRTFLQPVLPAVVREASLPLAAFASLLWAVHPLQTAAVTCMVQRAESLMGLFYLLTLYAFIRGAESGHGWKWFVGSVLACLAGMSTKEPMVTAPLIVFLYDRAFLAGSFRDAWRRRGRWHMALAATLLVLAWLLIQSGSRGGSAGFGTPMSSWHYAITQCFAVVHYLWLVIWPVPLVFDYGEGLVTNPMDVWLQALLLSVLGVGTLYALWKRPVAGFALAWIFIILAPSSSFFPSSHRTIVEHRMYLSLAGIAAFVAVCVYYRAGKYRAIVGGVVAGILIVLTFHRNEVYRTELDLWLDSARKWPSNERAFRGVGTALTKEGRPEEAISYLTEALRLDPGNEKTLENLGVAYIAMENYPLALEKFQESLRVKDDNAYLHVNMGNTLLMLGRTQEASKHYLEALRLDPENAEANEHMGILMVFQQRMPEALTYFEKAVKLAPNSPESHNNLGMTLARMGRVDEALVQFREAVRLDPGYDQARANLMQLETIRKTSPTKATRMP